MDISLNSIIKKQKITYPKHKIAFTPTNKSNTTYTEQNTIKYKEKKIKNIAIKEKISLNNISYSSFLSDYKKMIIKNQNISNLLKQQKELFIINLDHNKYDVNEISEVFNDIENGAITNDESLIIINQLLGVINEN
jgi:hypothetical protein